MTRARRLILAGLSALSLLGSIGSAFAQVPAPVPALPDSERRTAFTITSSTCTCSVGFQLFGDAGDFQNWVEVFLNGTRANFNDPVFGWTITSPSGPLSNLARPITNAVLTFNNPQTGTVQIVGARRPRRTSQFQENNGVPTRNFNVVLSDIIAQNRETWDKINDVTGRALLSQPGVSLGLLPLPSVCQNGFLGFDATGLIPVCRTGSGSGNVTLPVVSGELACFNGTEGLLQGCGPPLPSGLTIPGPTFSAGAIPITGQGGTNVLFNPVFTDPIQIGIFVNPSAYNTATPGDFLAAYNMQHGTPTTPVPAGTKGNLVGYEANINTNQSPDDVPEDGTGGANAFGSTMVTGNGAPMQGVDITATINNKEANYIGLDFNIVNNVVSTTTQTLGMFLNSSGSVPVSTGIGFNGVFTVGIDFNNQNTPGGGSGIRHLTNMGFSGSPSYFIDGSSPADLVIIGGGTAGGMSFFGNSTAGTSGDIRFFNNAADQVEKASIDTNTGIATFAGEIVGGSASLPGTAVALSLTNGAGSCALVPTSGTTNFICSSDERLKRDIKDTALAIGYIDSFRVRDYTLKSDGSQHTGVIAQEVQKNHPEMVHDGKDGYLQVEAPDPWKLVKAMQELVSYNNVLSRWLTLLSLALVLSRAHEAPPRGKAPVRQSDDWIALSQIESPGAFSTIRNHRSRGGRRDGARPSEIIQSRRA